MSTKHCFFFDEYAAISEKTGTEESEISFLGEKGHCLVELSKEKAPIPQGFVISTAATSLFGGKSPDSIPDALMEEVTESIRKLEGISSKQLGSEENPLFLSIRTSAKERLPGLMGSMLNIGINDQSAAGFINSTNNSRCVWEMYIKYLQTYAFNILGLSTDAFDEKMQAFLSEKGYQNESELQNDDFEGLCTMYKEAIGESFPQDPVEQVRSVLVKAYQSWFSDTTNDARSKSSFSNDDGLAVIIMVQKFGNISETSGAGSFITRNTTTGENKPEGKFMLSCQGDELASGKKKPEPISKFEDSMPDAFAKLTEMSRKLEAHYKDIVEIEFTVENGEPFILMAKKEIHKSPQANIKISFDFCTEEMITKEEAIKRVSTNDIEELFKPRFEKAELNSAAPFAKGTAVSCGISAGQLYFDINKCKEMAGEGQTVILVEKTLKPDDIPNISILKGVILVENKTIDEAKVLGIPVVVGCSDIVISMSEKTVTVGETSLHEGDAISIDGSTGQIYVDKIPISSPSIDDQTDLLELLKWADEIATKTNARESINNGPTRGLQVMANIESAEEAEKARAYGAMGIGLFKTDGLFLGERAPMIQKILTATDEEEREGAYTELEEAITGDFGGVFEAMSGLPIKIRLLNTPLSEFLPDMEELAEEIATTKEKGKLDGDLDEEEFKEKQALYQKVVTYHETNPQIGNRGARLSIVLPKLLQLQIRAIVSAACTAKENESDPIAEITIPFACSENEIAKIRPEYEKIVAEIVKERESKLTFKFGTSIEVPRAALISDRLAQYSDFLLIDTNELTQFSFGLSRDEAESTFLPTYQAKEILGNSPFKTLDLGVRKLVKIATEKGRKQKGDLSIGICGDHGSDPESIRYCHSLGMNYVSCKPSGLPIARLSAALAVLQISQ